MIEKKGKKGRSMTWVSVRTDKRQKTGLKRAMDHNPVPNKL